MRPDPLTVSATYCHITVLLEEAVSALVLREDDCYLDGTFGRGGYSRALLEKLGTRGRLFEFDKDPQAIQTGKALVAEGGRFVIVQRSFTELGDEVRARGFEGRVDSVLFDLGVSPPQLDDLERGFSFLNDGPLDTRMNPSQGISTTKFIANVTEGEIARVFKEYGEGRFAKQVARTIMQRRQERPFERIADLAEVITVASPAWEKGKNLVTCAFQGLCIHVNNELGDLEHGPDTALESLAVGDRLVVVSFHSPEDRIIKLSMRKHAKGEADNLPRDLPIRSKVFEPRLKLLGKPQYVSEEGLRANPRPRSTVMRVVGKLR